MSWRVKFSIDGEEGSHTRGMHRRCSSASLMVLDLLASELIAARRIAVLFRWHVQHRSVIGFIMITPMVGEFSTDRT